MAHFSSISSTTLPAVMVILQWTGLITNLLSYLNDKLGLNDLDELVSFATTKSLYPAVRDKASPEELLLWDFFHQRTFEPCRACWALCPIGIVLYLCGG